MSASDMIAGVLSEHPDYRVWMIGGDGWTVHCAGEGCEWQQSIPALPLTRAAQAHRDGMDASVRAYRKHVAQQLVDAGLHVPAQLDHGPIVVHIEAPPEPPGGLGALLSAIGRRRSAL